MKIKRISRKDYERCRELLSRKSQPSLQSIDENLSCMSLLGLTSGKDIELHIFETDGALEAAKNNK